MSGPAGKGAKLSETFFVTELIDGITLRIHVGDRLLEGGTKALLALGDLLQAQYDAPVRLVVLEIAGQGDTPDAREAAETAEGGYAAIFSRHLTGLLHDMLLRAPYLSLASLTGPVRGAAAALALACDWRIFADGASLCLNDFDALDSQAGARLAELAGRSAALDHLLRRRPIEREAAIRLGLATAEGAALIDRLRELAAKRGNESTRILREAVRVGGDGDRSVGRLVRSLAAAKG